MLNIFNPGNIETSKGTPFIGEIIPSQHKRFATFSNMYYGYRQIYRLLNTYISQYDQNTIEKILNRYAPSIENHTKSYIQFVCLQSNVSPDAILIKSDKRLKQIVYWMSIMENSINVCKEYEKQNNISLMRICEDSYELINITSIGQGNEIIKTFQI